MLPNIQKRPPRCWRVGTSIPTLTIELLFDEFELIIHYFHHHQGTQIQAVVSCGGEIEISVDPEKILCIFNLVSNLRLILAHFLQAVAINMIASQAWPPNSLNFILNFSS